MAGTLFDKVWDRHVVADLGDGFALLFVDRHMMNDMAARGLLTLNKRGLPLRNPQFTFAAADHTVATLWNARAGRADNPYVKNLRENAARHGFHLFDVDDPAFGIVHVIAAEQAIALPGTTLACGDSHTCTLGALGAVAWGLGQSDLVHILATQTSVQRKPKTMRITVDGALGEGVSPKDLILFLIAQLGVSGGAGYAVEFAGEAIRAMTMEGRFTVCNMAVELGARYGMIAPDETTFAYLEGRAGAPRGAMWEKALADWRTLVSGGDADFDAEHRFNAADIQPQISWGTNPSQTIGLHERVPRPEDVPDDSARAAWRAAIEYSGLTPGRPIAGVPVDRVFIGSCTNARITDLRTAAAVVRGRHVAPNVEAWISPGSESVRSQAEAEGLDRIFIEAGFGWGRAGCSMCAGAGDQMREIGSPG
ncbi:MAG TPA: 3-isopropylmalate dehydratase large subunit, partial [Sphingomonadaceae bacterium]|nr:3-isopropylmalate dehydratase large subunit [Sphingomonadaceae bacterium]